MISMPLTGSPPEFTSSTKMGGSYMLPVVGVMNGNDCSYEDAKRLCGENDSGPSFLYSCDALHTTNRRCSRSRIAQNDAKLYGRLQSDEAFWGKATLL